MSPAPQPGSPPSAPLGTRARLTSLDYLLQPSLTAAGGTPCPSVSGCSSNARPQAPDLNEVGDCRPRRWRPSTHTGDPQGQGWTWEGDARAKEGRYRCNTGSRKEAEAGRSMAQTAQTARRASPRPLSCPGQTQTTQQEDQPLTPNGWWHTGLNPRTHIPQACLASHVLPEHR